MRWGLIGRFVAVVFVIVGATATAARADVTPAEDNPPGCTAAGYGNNEQCGAQGRNDFNDAKHVAPIDACKDTRSPIGSLVTRVLPDGPRHPDGTLAFVSGVCVYLPPGYGSGALRYSVLYLLHGGGGDQAAWVSLGGVQKILDDAYAADPTHAVIAVMPDGRSGNWHDFYDGQYLNEQYFLHAVVPYVDAHYRTIANRQGRAIVGLSNGGYGALHFAAKAPDLFIAAGGMSSNLGARTMDSMGGPAFRGAPFTSNELGAFYYGNIPLSLVPNLDGVNVTMDLGATCTSQTDLSSDLCALLAVDTLFKYDNQAFRDAMNAQHHVGAFEYRETEGEHAWRWWSLWLRERHLPFVWKYLAKPQPAGARVAPIPVPATFRYRSISADFSVYGFRFETTRPHPEFLDVTRSGNQLTLTGTGAVVVTTPDGRVLKVDLGPGHAAEQYSAQARIEEAAGSYKFVTQTIDIRPASVEGARIQSARTIPETGGSTTPPLIGAALVGLALLIRRSMRAARAR